MVPEPATVAWRVAGRSVCGAAHRRRGSENQDAIGWSRAGESAIVAAVADGHGSPACFRSAVGAELAVRCAMEALGGFFEQHAEWADAAAAARRLAAELAARWREAVDRDVDARPFPEGKEEQARRLAYGSTVLAALATPDYVLYLQLGDGDILIVSADGSVARPWPRDYRLLGVETTSLCGTDAAEETRVAVEARSEAWPALIMLATDGYANSFREDDGFLRAGGDLLEMIREDGIERVEADLESWLNEASELGSGDDITVAVLWRAAAGACHGG